MSSVFRIELNRTRAIAVSVCLLAACILFFATGTISGLLLASASLGRETAKAEAAALRSKPISAKSPQAPIPAAPPAAPAGNAASAGETPSGNPPSLATLPSAPQTPASAQPSGSPSAPSPAPAAPSTPGAPANPAGPAATPAPSAALAASDTAYSPLLAVKVCSFMGKTGAENLVAALDAKGYRASVIRSVGARRRLWYVVMLGPYKEWNSAAEVAAQVAVAENVRPVVGQMR